MDKERNFKNMEFNDLVKQLDSFKDSEEYNNYVTGFMTDDRVKQYLDTENGKKLIQPEMDKYFSKGLETWKTNNLQNLIDEEVKKRFPAVDPKDAEIANMKAQLEAMQKEAERNELKNKALKLATEKGLPVDLIDYFVCADEKATNEAIKAFEKAFKASVSNAVDEKLKGNHIPPKEEQPEMMDGVTAAFKALNPSL